jgi:hypothetical protein
MSRFLTNACSVDQYRMSRKYVLPSCPHPTLDSVRKETWDRPDEDGKMRKRPTSLGQLLGKSKWEKPLADWRISIVLLVFCFYFYFCLLA